MNIPDRYSSLASKMLDGDLLAVIHRGKGEVLPKHARRELARRFRRSLGLSNKHGQTEENKVLFKIIYGVNMIEHIRDKVRR